MFCLNLYEMHSVITRMRHDVCYNFSILDVNKPLSLVLFVLQRPQELKVLWLNRVFLLCNLFFSSTWSWNTKLIHKTTFHLSYPFWLKTTLLEIQSLLNSAKKKKKMQLQMDTLSRELNLINPEHFPAYQVRNVVFRKYHNDILKQLWWFSGKSPYCRVGSWNFNSSSPWVATLGFLCEKKAVGCAGEEFFVWSQDATLAGGGCVGPGLAWRGAVLNTYLAEWGGFKGLQEGKKRVLVQNSYSLFF